MKNIKIFIGGLVIAWSTIASFAQQIDEYSSETIANIKAGYECNKALSLISIENDSLAAQYARTFLATQALKKYAADLNQNNIDLKWSQRKNNIKSKESYILLKKSKRENMKLKIGIGALLLLFGLTLK